MQLLQLQAEAEGAAAPRVFSSIKKRELSMALSLVCCVVCAPALQLCH
jgi:hypothetical protein